MTQTETNIYLVQRLYEKNSTYAAIGGDGIHTLVVNLDRWECVKPEKVRFPDDNFPYVKVAILDRYLEETNE